MTFLARPAVRRVVTPIVVFLFGKATGTQQSRLQGNSWAGSAHDALKSSRRVVPVMTRRISLIALRLFWLALSAPVRWVRFELGLYGRAYEISHTTCRRSDAEAATPRKGTVT